MKKFIALVILLCTVIISSTALAARGIVVFYSPSSSKIVIETQMGFTCGEVIDLPFHLSRDDTVDGDLENFGSHEIYNLTEDEHFSLWIDKYWLNKEEVIDWLERGY